MNQHLDVLTPKGQKSIVDEQKAKAIFLRNFSEYNYIETHKDKSADVDAFLTKDLVIKAIIETKCRYDVTIEEFKERYKSQWLITFDKLERAKVLAKILQVDVVGFLYLVQSETLLVQKIIDDGEYVGRIVIEKTKTQKTINGGSVERVNAFIDMTQARSFK